MSGGWGGGWGDDWGGGSGGPGGGAGDTSADVPESLAAEEVPVALTPLAISRIALEYLDAQKFLRVVAILGDLLQDVEAVLTTIPKLDDPAFATGVNLDVTGDIVGQTRSIPPGDPAGDPLYRLMIYARIGRNNARCRNEEIIASLSLLLGDPAIQFFDWGDMAIGYAIGRPLSTDEVAILGTLNLLPVPMGVSVNPRFTFDPLNSFLFNTDGRGLSDGAGVGGGTLGVGF